MISDLEFVLKAIDKSLSTARSLAKQAERECKAEANATSEPLAIECAMWTTELRHAIETALEQNKATGLAVVNKVAQTQIRQSKTGQLLLDVF